MKYFSILPIALYLIWIVATIGPQKSISETYYLIKHKILFWFALNLTAWSFVIGYVLHSDSHNIAFLLFSAIGIGYTATAARFKEKLIGTIHYIGALSAYISGYLFIIFEKGWLSVYYIFASLLLMLIFRISENQKEDEWVNSLFDKNEYGTTKEHINKSIWYYEIIGLITIYLATIL